MNSGFKLFKLLQKENYFLKKDRVLAEAENSEFINNDQAKAIL